MLAFAMPVPMGASIQDEIDAKTQQIEALQQQIQAYQAQADQAGAQSRTLQNEIARLNAQIGQITAEVNSLRASIDRTGLEISQTNTQITDAEHTIAIHQEALAQSLRETDALDQQPLAFILLQHDALSEFFDYVHNVQRAQDTIRIAIQSITDLKGQLEDHEEKLRDQRSQLEQLKALQEVQQRQLASTKGQKNQILTQTKGQESKYQQLVAAGKRDLKALQEQIYYLQQNGISVNDAVKYAELAAIGAGIRPAFLLALLEVESRLGLNVGTGNWKDDMYLCYLRLANYYPSKKAYYTQRAETEKAAFFNITTALGLNPDAQKVSREPTYGCGGAMGPAQFIPSTWLAYDDSVMRITGRSTTNPWNAEDAFTAAAIKLANAGATSKTRTGELAAAKAYIGGSPNCTQAICYSYANTVLTKAAQIEQSL